MEIAVTAARSAGVIDRRRLRRPRWLGMKSSKVDLGRLWNEARRKRDRGRRSERKFPLATIGSMDSGGEGRDLELRDYLVVLRRRKVTILVTTAMVLIA